MFCNKLPKSNNVISHHKPLITNRTVQDAPPITSTPEPVFPLSRPLESQAPINNYENVNFGSFLYNPKTGW